MPDDDLAATQLAEWQLASTATDRLRPDEIVAVFTLALQKHCTADQIISERVAPSIEDDPTPACLLVSQALVARKSLRDQLDTGEYEGISSNPIIRPINELDELYPGNSNPFFDQDDLRALELAERALGRYFGSKEAFDRTMVQRYEERAQDVVRWAEVSCPDIPADVFNLPSVLDVAALPSADDSAGAQQRFCGSFESMWAARFLFRQAVPEDGRSTAFTSDTRDAYFRMMQASQDMREQLEAENYLIAPAGDLPFDNGDIWDMLAIERQVRQAYFAEVTVPINQSPLQRPQAAFDRMETHMTALCDLDIDWTQPVASLPGPSFAVDVQGPFDETKADTLFCPNLELLVQTQASWRERLAAVDLSDALDVEDAAAIQLRMARHANRHLRLLLLLEPEIEHADAAVLGTVESQIRAAMNNSSSTPLVPDFEAQVANRGDHLALISPLCPRVELSGFRSDEADIGLFKSLVAAQGE